MYEVWLVAEDGDYCLTDPMSEGQAIRWAKSNQNRYGEGQRLELRYYGEFL